jgi:hypothetical protein
LLLVVVVAVVVLVAVDLDYLLVTRFRLDVDVFVSKLLSLCSSLCLAFACFCCVTVSFLRFSQLSRFFGLEINILMKKLNADIFERLDLLLN